MKIWHTLDEKRPQDRTHVLVILKDNAGLLTEMGSPWISLWWDEERRELSDTIDLYPEDNDEVAFRWAIGDGRIAKWAYVEDIAMVSGMKLK